MALAAAPIYVKLQIAEHPTPDGKICTADNHDKCDWDMLLKDRFGKMFPEIQIQDLKSIDNTIYFEASYEDIDISETDIVNKLDWFFTYNPEMAVKFVRVSQDKYTITT